MKNYDNLLADAATGTYTLQEIGEKYGISRERVRQVWKRAKGYGFDAHRLRLKHLWELSHEEHLKEIKFVCTGCEKPITFKEGFHKSKYCNDCRILYTTINIDLSRWHICKTCGIKFRPKVRFAHHRNPKTYHGRYRGYFCSKKCYFGSPQHQKAIVKATMARRKLRI